MRRFGSYALIATYLVVQLFGQVIHAWSGCEHAHLPGQFHSHVTVAHNHGVHADHHHGKDSHGHDHDHSTPSEGPGWNEGNHQHSLAIDGCLLCQHLALGQMATSTAHATVDTVMLQQVVLQSTRPATEKWLGPNSPRAPPVA